MEAENNMDNIKTDVALLKHDIDRLGELFDKLDITIEKLTEVSSGINKMLAVHENRLGQQEEITRQIFLLIEERRKETSEKMEKLHTKIAQQRQEVDDNISKRMKSIDEKLDKVTDLVNKLNLWKYMVIGGAGVAGFVVSFIVSKLSGIKF